MSRPPVTVMSILQPSGSAIGRFDSECGAIGTIRKPRRPGCMIGPFADSEYAVEPVGVETIRPSERWLYMKRSVDVDGQLDHARHRAARHDDVVQRERTEHLAVRFFGAAAVDAARQQRAFLDLVSTGQHVGQRLDHRVERDVRHEAEPALVDADQRHVVRRELARDAEHRAVAADDDRGRGLRADLRVVERRIVLQRAQVRGVAVDDDAVAGRR